MLVTIGSTGTPVDRLPLSAAFSSQYLVLQLVATVANFQKLIAYHLAFNMHNASEYIWTPMAYLIGVMIKWRCEMMRRPASTRRGQY